MLSPQLIASATAGSDRIYGQLRLVVALLVLTVAVLKGYNLPAGTVVRSDVVGPDGEIYGNATAEKLVQEARKYDPLFCPEEQRDRDKAIFWYKQAMDAQPGAKINAALADRVAQLYAFYADRKNKVAPIRDNARHWWSRCLDLTNPKQLLWAQAQMGLTNVAADTKAAMTACNNIQKMDARQIELDDWKVWPEGDSDRDKAIRDGERERLRKQVAEIQTRATKKKARIEEQAKLNESRKAAEAIPHQEPKPSRWNYKKSLMVALWAVLVAAFVGRRVVNRRNQVKHS